MNPSPSIVLNQDSITAHSKIVIDKPAHHVKVLGKHFASKVDVNFLEFSTQVIFEEGGCIMTPHLNEIECLCNAACKSDLKEITDTIDRHINAFFRKKDIDIDWTIVDVNSE